MNNVSTDDCCVGIRGPGMTCCWGCWETRSPVVCFEGRIGIGGGVSEFIWSFLENDGASIFS